MPTAPALSTPSSATRPSPTPRPEHEFFVAEIVFGGLVYAGGASLSCAVLRVPLRAHRRRLREERRRTSGRDQCC
eukprot:11875545-Alexandrium_andersonii.AAC.1